MGERDIELDRLKTTIFALNQKLELSEANQIDLQATREQLKESENKRKCLQEKMEDSRTSIIADTQAHISKQTSMLDDIAELKT